jgi:hypothetical protein
LKVRRAKARQKHTGEARSFLLVLVLGSPIYVLFTV